MRAASANRETALEVVKRGHRLIADDLVEVRRVSDTTLLGRAPEIIRHLIEIRGIGILDVKELYGVSSVKMQENIDFVINLELWDEKKTYERLGINEETTDILGIDVPSITIPGPSRPQPGHHCRSCSDQLPSEENGLQRGQGTDRSGFRAYSLSLSSADDN